VNNYLATVSTAASILLAGSLTLAAPEEKKLQPHEGESPCLANIRQVTFASMGFINAGEAYFSPDARTIIFQATPKGKTEYQIYTLELKEGAEPRMVSTGRGACTCSYFHPTKSKIIFASSHLDPQADQPKPDEGGHGYAWDFNEHMDIFEADPDGSNLRRLTSAPGYDAEGTYSNDGSKIVFTSQRDGDLEIYVMNADGTDQRRITHGKGYDGGPFFSPDGKTILYRGDRRSDDKMNLQIRMVDADGSNDRAITDNDVFNWCPYWHPSGKSFIYTRADHEAWSKGERPNYDLYMLTPAGGEPRRITHHPAFDGLPVFSPDGKQLLWTSQRGDLEEPQIFLADFTAPSSMR
jgi:Tol biopolymer transport system component